HLYLRFLHDALPISVFSIFYISILVLLEPVAGKWLTPLHSFGRMALSNYIGQSVILVSILAFIPVDTIVSYKVATIVCLLVVGRSEEHTSQLQSRFD